MTLFESEWPSTGTSGAKRLNISQSYKRPDQFKAFGKDRGCVPSGKWFDVMRLAVNILNNSNTERVVTECDWVPTWAYLKNTEYPEVMDYYDGKYERRGPYYRPDAGSDGDNYTRTDEFDQTALDILDDCNGWPDTSVGEKPTMLKQGARPGEFIEPDLENLKPDTWVYKRGLNSSKPRGTWWEWMCFAIDVLESENTKWVVQHTDDLPDALTLDNRDTSAFIRRNQPYEFVDDETATDDYTGPRDEPRFTF